MNYLKQFLLIIIITLVPLNLKLNAQETIDLISLYQEALKND